MSACERMRRKYAHPILKVRRICVETGNVEKLRKLIETFPQVVNIKNLKIGGITPLQLAVSQDFFSVVKCLVEECQVGVNDLSDMGFTALHVACQRNFCETVEYLIGKGARVDIEDANENTPLDVCAPETRRLATEAADKYKATILQEMNASLANEKSGKTAEDKTAEDGAQDDVSDDSSEDVVRAPRGIDPKRVQKVKVKQQNVPIKSASIPTPDVSSTTAEVAPLEKQEEDGEDQEQEQEQGTQLKVELAPLRDLPTLQNAAMNSMANDQSNALSTEHNKSTSNSSPADPSGTPLKAVDTDADTDAAPSASPKNKSLVQQRREIFEKTKLSQKSGEQDSEQDASSSTEQEQAQTPVKAQGSEDTAAQGEQSTEMTPGKETKSKPDVAVSTPQKIEEPNPSSTSTENLDADAVTDPVATNEPPQVASQKLALAERPKGASVSFVEQKEEEGSSASTECGVEDGNEDYDDKEGEEEEEEEEDDDDDDEEEDEEDDDDVSTDNADGDEEHKAYAITQEAEVNLEHIYPAGSDQPGDSTVTVSEYRSPLLSGRGMEGEKMEYSDINPTHKFYATKRTPSATGYSIQVREPYGYNPANLSAMYPSPSPSPVIPAARIASPLTSLSPSPPYASPSHSGYSVSIPGSTNTQRHNHNHNRSQTQSQTSPYSLAPQQQQSYGYSSSSSGQSFGYNRAIQSQEFYGMKGGQDQAQGINSFGYTQSWNSSNAGYNKSYPGMASGGGAAVAGPNAQPTGGYASFPNTYYGNYVSFASLPSQTMPTSYGPSSGAMSQTSHYYPQQFGVPSNMYPQAAQVGGYSNGNGMYNNGSAYYYQ